MRLYWKCTKLNRHISKKEKDCVELYKLCKNCPYKIPTLLNWKCNQLNLTIKKKITYCGQMFNNKCENCPSKSKMFEAEFD